MSNKTQLESMRLMILGMISQLPPADQAKVQTAKREISSTIASFGECGEMAFGLLGVEEAIKTAE